MFSKKAFTIEEQINQLQKRGLEIPNYIIAAKYLANISYYRLGEYWYVMQENKEEHTFKPNSKFKDVIALYNFDAELRLLLFGVIEKIEISLRTKLIYHLSHEIDPWWFCNSEIFNDRLQFSKTLAKIEEEITRARSKDVTIKSHFKKYKNDFRFPPAWKSLEQVSFGNLSKLYGNLKHTIKAKDTIAKEFGAVNHTYLPSWLQSIAQIRNFCAHHSRLWNRNLPATVKLLPKPPNPWINEKENVPRQHEFSRLYIHICLMQYLLNTIQPKNGFSTQLNELFKKYPNVDPNALGIKPQWQKEPLWK
ncbi:Abi family protein [Aequorivita sp. 609]|uniref:Abi family protein n=1 Tax=Aequorivita TaxID=153265 RepID=UPI00161BA436|nr:MULTISPECIES: Abi family protein [Aequorivita]MBB6679942.1 Abi family protein [Aequorivita sp. 609]